MEKVVDVVEVLLREVSFERLSTGAPTSVISVAHVWTATEPSAPQSRRRQEPSSDEADLELSSSSQSPRRSMNSVRC